MVLFAWSLATVSSIGGMKVPVHKQNVHRHDGMLWLYTCWIQEVRIVKSLEKFSRR
jgi:hypothetical protein